MTETSKTNKVCFILPGSGESSMKARVDAVINDIEKNTASTVLVTGYKREIKYILDLLESKGIGNEIIPTYSYDTLTNISNLYDEIGGFEAFDKIIIPTSKLHGERFYTIFEKFYPQSKDKLELIDSKEGEARFARQLSSIYRNLDPRIVQLSSIVLRPKLFLSDYLFPKYHVADNVNNCKAHFSSFLSRLLNNNHYAEN